MDKNTGKNEQLNTSHARAEATAQRKELFLRLMEQKLGVIAEACRCAGIGRTIVYEWKKNDADFAEKIDDIQKQFAPDIAESKLMELIQGITIMTERGEVYKRPPDIRAIKLFLEARAQHRGYGQRFQKPLVLESNGAATGRPDEVKTATADTLFRVSSDLGATGAEMTKAIEHVATPEEFATLQNVFERVRKHLAESGTLKPLSPNK
jgi:hypothetical protein